MPKSAKILITLGSLLVSLLLFYIPKYTQHMSPYWFIFSSTGYTIFDQNNKIVENTSQHRKFPQFPFNENNCRYKNRDAAKVRIKQLTEQ